MYRSCNYMLYQTNNIYVLEIVTTLSRDTDTSIYTNIRNKSKKKLT